MLELFLFTLGALLLLGFVTAIWLVIKFFSLIFGSKASLPAPAPHRYNYQTYQPPPPPPAPVPTMPRHGLTRVEALELLESEIRRAQRAQALSMQACTELFEYIERQRGRLPNPGFVVPWTPVSTPLPDPVPQTVEPHLVPMVEFQGPLPDAVNPERMIEIPVAEFSDARPPRDSEQIGMLVAKLHADAQAPVPPEPAIVQRAETELAPTQPALEPVREEARAGEVLREQAAPVVSVKSNSVPTSDEIIHAAPVTPQPELTLPVEPAFSLPSPTPSTPPNPPPAPTPAPKRTLAERLFTPENVRILQSLGIGIIFISAVAFVKMNMWEGSSAWQQMGLLLAGTVFCSAVGYSLRRFTSLRITGLGFLILGQLSIVLDTYAALVHQGPGSAPIYPWPPSSLWFVSMLLFTASSWWQARKLDEALFYAFTFFGGLAAYGSAVIFSGITGDAGERWWMLPAAYVPALTACGIFAGWKRSRGEHFALGASGWRRWTLWWWMESAWSLGAGVLAFLVPMAAIFSGRAELAQLLGWHIVALLLLASGMLFDSHRRNSSIGAGLSASLLLAIAPLFAYAQAWPLEEYCVALALPGALLALGSLAIRRWIDQRAEKVYAPISVYGLCASTVGAVWALGAWVTGHLGDAQAAWCAAGLAAVGLAIALLEGASWAAWLGTLGAAFLASTLTQAAGLPMEWSSVAWLGLALCIHLPWALAAGRHPAAKAGARSADLLAYSAAFTLLVMAFTQWNLSHSLHLSVCWGSGLFALYLGASAALNRGAREVRAGLCAAALAPFMASIFYHMGLPPESLPVWLVLLSIAIQLVGQFAWGRQQKLADAICLGACASLLHGVALALWQADQGLRAAAAISLALAAISLALQALRLRRRESLLEGWVLGAECLALGALAGAGWNAAHLLDLPGDHWPLVLSFLAAALLLVSMLAEALDFGPHKQRAGALPPFHFAGGLAALALSVGAGFELLGLLFGKHGCFFEATRHAPLVLSSLWAGALAPLFIAMRGDTSSKRREHSAWLAHAGLITAFALLGLALFQTLFAKFWLANCPADLRAACALFFGVALLGSSALGWLKRRALAPVTGTLALFGLIGCAYGAWALPQESFGLVCVLTAGVLSAAGEWLLRRGEPRQAQARAFATLAPAFVLLGVGQLAYGLVTWAPGAQQVYGLVAWSLLALGCARKSGNLTGRTAGVAAFSASAAAVLAGCHALRCAGLGFADFGPGLAGAALILLPLREAVARAGQAEELDRRARAAGLLSTALLSAGAALALACWGQVLGHLWTWSATLLLEAAFTAALSVLVRREKTRPEGAALLALELCAWTFLSAGVYNGIHAGDWLELVGPVQCELFAGLVVLLGFACEALAGALIPVERRTQAPVAFLESRHLAAAVIALGGVVCAFVANRPFELPALQATWGALFSAGLLAAYASMAEWSATESTRRRGRSGAALAAYVVLIPAGYLCLLKAHSTGSDWGALWFLALAPFQLLAAHALNREQYAAQSALARWGAALVSLGSVVLAFAGNHARMAEVPCATFAALTLLALLARLFSKGPERRAFALAALVATAGAGFFGMRALMGDLAYGVAEPSVWEWPGMAALGLSLVVIGGLSKWEPDAKGRSLAGIFGVGLAALALSATLGELGAHGPRAHYLHLENVVRLEAFVTALLIASATCIAARRWLNFGAGEYLAPIFALCGYGLFIWTMHPQAWEWYSMPAAVLLFVWARSKADELEKLGPAGPAHSEVSLLLALASAAALVPSFAQALAYSPEALLHYLVLVLAGLVLVGGAMLTRRKIPLLGGSAAVLLGTLVKAVQWAAHREVIFPVLGLFIGFAVLAVGCLFESRMNRAIRETVDRVRAEARMFWVSWE